MDTFPFKHRLSKKISSCRDPIMYFHKISWILPKHVGPDLSRPPPIYREEVTTLRTLFVTQSPTYFVNSYYRVPTGGEIWDGSCFVLPSMKQMSPAYIMHSLYRCISCCFSVSQFNSCCTTLNAF